MFKLSKKTGVMAIIVILLSAVILGYGYYQKTVSQKTFFGDGYIMSVGTVTENVQPKPVYFQAGTAYEVQYPNKVVFKSMGGKRESLPSESFLHFADGSISSLTDGVALELGELKNGLVNYYNIKDDSVMQKQDQGYVLDNKGVPIPFAGFVWKLTDHKFLAFSDGVTVTLPNGETPKLSGYVEVNYIDDGVVQLVSDEAAYQVLSSGTKIELNNGMGIDLDTRMITADGQEKMSLDGIALTSDTSITVSPSGDLNLKVPKFDITTIDGKKGDSGELGEQGTEGIKGEEGEKGTDGDEGTEGMAGEGGNAGSTGNSGSNGSNGSSGSAGANGASGKSGGTGGTGGTGGDGQTVVMPAVTLSEFTYTTTTVEGTVFAGEGNNVALGDARLSILNLSTGKAVYTEDLGNMDSMPTAKFSYTQLEPDKEYRLKVDIEYELSIDLEDGTAKTGEREFISRVFSTSSYGVMESYSYATPNKLVIKVEKKDYSDIQSGTLTLIKQDGITDERVISFAGGSRQNTVEFGNLKSNTDYKVKLNIVGNNGEETVSIHQYKTLKTPPVIGGKPVVAINPRGYFEFRPLVNQELPFSDEDRGIEKYIYEVYEANHLDGDFVAAFETADTSAVAAYIDGVNLIKNKKYVVRLVAQFYDNEKTVEYATDFSDEFYMDNTSGAPYLTFTDVSAVSGGETGVNFESVTGNIKFYSNHANLDTASDLRLTIYSEAFSHDSILMNFTTEQLNADSYFDTKVDLKGLRKNTTYRFNVYGKYKGDLNESLLATCVVTTPEAETIKVKMESVESSSGGIAVRVFFINDKGDQVIPRTAATVREMKVELYEGISSLPIKSEKIQFAAPSDNPWYGSEFVNYFSDPEGLVITNTDLGMSTSSLNDNASYTISIEGLYDYTGIDEYRYGAGTFGTYQNKINLDGTTKCSLKKQLTAPPLPETPMTIRNIVNSQLPQMGFQKAADLSDDTVVGMVLMPGYDNSSGFARKASYYIYDYKEYDQWVGTIPADKAADKPLYSQREHAVVKYDYDLRTASPDANGRLPKLIVFMEDVNTNNITEGDISANSGATSEWKGMRYIKAGSFKPVENKGADVWSRGSRYIAAYDLILNINENLNYEYPYNYAPNDNESGKYDDVSKILRGETKIPRMIPQFVIYPYDMNTREKTASWKVKATNDPDHSLTTESFLLSSDNGNFVSSSLEGLNEDELYDKLTGSFTEIGFDKDQVSGALIKKAETSQAENDNLTLKVRYNAYEDGSGPDQLGEKTLVTQNFKTVPNDMAQVISTYTELRAEKDDDANAIKFTISKKDGITDKAFSEYLKLAESFYVKVEGKEEFYLNLSLRNVSYEASLPLADISGYVGKTIKLDCGIWYEDTSYGYKYSSVTDSKKRYAIQDQFGNYYIPKGNTGTLKTASEPAGSIYSVEKGASIEQDRIRFDCKNMMWKVSYGNSLELKLSEYGAVLPDAPVSRAAVVLKPLNFTEGSGGNWGKLELKFDSMVPVILDYTVTKGLTTAKLTMDITKNVDSLLAETVEAQKKGQYAYVLLEKLVGTTYKPVTTLVIPLETLIPVKGSGKAEYQFVGLEKDTYYRATLMGVLAGDSSGNKTAFKMPGSEKSIMMKTLGTVEAPFSTVRYNNYNYNNKYMTFVHNLDTLENLKLRYRLEEVETSGNIIQVYGHQEMVNDGLITLPGSYGLTGNIVRLSCGPGTKIQFGHTYRMVSEIYTSAADFLNMKPEELEKEKVGEGTSRNLTVPAINQPAAKVNYTLAPLIADGKEDYSRQTMSIAVSIADETGIIATDHYGKYVFTGLEGTLSNVYDKEGNELTAEGNMPDAAALAGSYMIRLEMEDSYRENGTDVPISDRWVSIPQENIEPPSGETGYDDYVMYGMRGINLKDLKPGWKYRLTIYASVNPELKKGAGIISRQMIEQGQASKIGQFALNTADLKGVYVDKDTLLLEQISEDQVTVTLTNPTGLEQVKYMRCDFIPEVGQASSGVYSGLMTFGEGDGYDARMTTDTTNSGEGITKVIITFHANFYKESDEKKRNFYINIRLYGAGKPGDDVESDSNILFSGLDKRLFVATILKTKTKASSRSVVMPHTERAIVWEPKNYEDRRQS